MARKRNKRIIDWENHLLNFFGVVLGVLIAFWLNSWAHDRKERQTAVTALKNIRNELLKNKESVDSTVANHIVLFEFLDAYLPNVTDDMEARGSYRIIDSLVVAYPQYLNGRSDIEVPARIYQLSDVAWQTAVDAGIVSNLDFDLAYQLNQVYDLQEKLNSIDETIIENLNGITGRKETFENLKGTTKISQSIARNLQDSSFYYSSIQAIDDAISN